MVLARFLFKKSHFEIKSFNLNKFIPENIKRLHISRSFPYGLLFSIEQKASKENEEASLFLYLRSNQKDAPPVNVRVSSRRIDSPIRKRDESPREDRERPRPVSFPPPLSLSFSIAGGSAIRGRTPSWLVA